MANKINFENNFTVKKRKSLKLEQNSHLAGLNNEK